MSWIQWWMRNGLVLGHGAWPRCMANRSAKSWVNVELLQFPTYWPMSGLFVHWSRGWGVLSFSERLVYETECIGMRQQCTHISHKLATHQNYIAWAPCRFKLPAVRPYFPNDVQACNKSSSTFEPHIMDHFQGNRGGQWIPLQWASSTKLDSMWCSRQVNNLF